ncbi:MAG: ABC transporter ATP-binding protein [Candidatus Wallbacteria bacterium]|nr:ABC transporter ATP-binding protein [Candidatus Wallbacteria bacterium]
MDKITIQLKDIRKKFLDKRVLNGINLELGSGSILGLLGQNGAGKTTLIRIMVGLLEHDAGEISILGLSPIRDHVELMNRVGYLPENRDLYDWMTVSEIIAFCKGIYKEWDDTLVEKNRKRIGIADNQRIADLSFGQRSMLCLILALGHKPQVLILDDPSAGLDITTHKEILAAIIREAADNGTSVLLSSHFIGEIERVCDRIAILRDGVFKECQELDSLLSKFSCALITGGEHPDTIVLEKGDNWAKVVIPSVAAKDLERNAKINEIRPATLEEIYLALAR